jgi:hypothetical protein
MSVDMHRHAQRAQHGLGERRNSLLKATSKALRNVSRCPWKIGDIVAAALVLLHVEDSRTT